MQRFYHHAYIRSSNTLSGADFTAEHTSALRAQVAARIGKATGLFIAK